MLKTAQPGAIADNAYMEAYMSILYRFLLGHHAQRGLFVRHDDGGTKKLYAAIELDPSFVDAFSYHLHPNSYPLLPDKKGLAGIIVASLLLGEVDLKGIGSKHSNLGIITQGGEKKYFKIDNGQSFFGFGDNGAYYKLFNLLDPPDRLKKPKGDDVFLKSLSLDGRLSQDYLDAIHQEAKRIASVDDALLNQVLDFCEKQLAYLASYPGTRLEVLGVHPSNPLFSAPDYTFKDRILKRFAQLRQAIK